MNKMWWNVFREDINSREIEVFNIFCHGSFSEDVTKLKKKKLSREEFAKELKSISMYYFWCKSEHEVVITSWPPYIDSKELDRLNTEYEEHNQKWGRYPYRMDVRLDVGKKIDIYQQLSLNWENFVDYVYNS